LTKLIAQSRRVKSEGVRRRKDGSRLETSILRVPIRVPGGEVSVYAIYRDVTESKRAEVLLRQSRERLRALAARLQSIRESEQARIARDLHDELGQMLTARIAAELRPEALDRLGLVPALREEVRRFEERTGIKTEAQLHDSVPEPKPEMAPSQALGLLGMVERAMALGGDVRFESERGRGTVVTASIPLDVAASRGGS
jgi:signal transduction histidine kinase